MEKTSYGLSMQLDGSTEVKLSFKSRAIFLGFVIGLIIK